MTQLRHCKCSLSNYFDRVLDGIGHRGSSFSDIDSVSHDGQTNRFLIQEFKREHEKRESAQHWMLREFTKLVGGKLPDHFTVWLVVKLDDGGIGWAAYGDNPTPEPITVAEYQERFRCWWEDVPYASPSSAPPATSCASGEMMTANEIKW